MYGENGWIAAARDPEYGGQGFPHMMRIVINDLMYGACQAFNMAPSLTHGAAHLIENFGSRELKERFVPPMFSGQWAGTMALTEPQAGSNLAAIRTGAVPEGRPLPDQGLQDLYFLGRSRPGRKHHSPGPGPHRGGARGRQGHFPVRGAQDPGQSRTAPWGNPTTCVCGGVEKKLGLHASPTCLLHFGEQDGCIGYLCGEANNGLAHMFQMMNAARINTGVSGMTLAGTAYLNALAYARERIQGTDAAGRKPGQVPIIDHPDVRRMLLWMKATVDGMRSMIYTGAFWSDLALELPAGEEKSHYQALVDFLTPIIKAYCSDMGFKVCETAIQCLGGYGFCREYPLEQYLRDSKIMSLYEGTNGIQSVDLLGRKMRLNGGALFKSYLSEIQAFCRKHSDAAPLGPEIRALSEGRRPTGEPARTLSEKMKTDPLQWASYTYPALLCFGDITMVWRLLDLAVIAQEQIEAGNGNDFLSGKVLQATYFTGTTLPLTLARLETCLRSGREVVDMPEGRFLAEIQSRRP